MNIFYKDGEIATKNLTPGIKVYDEKLIREGENAEGNETSAENIEEYRIWNPRRSKLAAALLNGLEDFDLKNDSKVLYLGASTGTTVSHISDICDSGLIYAVEFSPVSMKKLVRLSQKRNNIAPILADATKPKYYLRTPTPSAMATARMDPQRGHLQSTVPPPPGGRMGAPARVVSSGSSPGCQMPPGAGPSGRLPW